MWRKPGTPFPEGEGTGVSAGGEAVGVCVGAGLGVPASPVEVGLEAAAADPGVAWPPPHADSANAAHSAPTASFIVERRDISKSLLRSVAAGAESAGPAGGSLRQP